MESYMGKGKLSGRTDSGLFRQVGRQILAV